MFSPPPGSAVVVFFATLVMQLWVYVYTMRVCENVEWNKRFYYSNFNSSLSHFFISTLGVPLGSEIFMALFGTIFFVMASMRQLASNNSSKRRRKCCMFFSSLSLDSCASEDITHTHARTQAHIMGNGGSFDTIDAVI